MFFASFAMDVPRVLQNLVVSYLDYCTDKVPKEWEPLLIKNTTFEEYMNTSGNKHFFANGKLHRYGGHAVEYADGTKFWYENNELHRVDGPAIEYVNGNTSWWQNGRLHRADGPAVEKPNGMNEWWVNGSFKKARSWHCLSQ